METGNPEIIIPAYNEEKNIANVIKGIGETLGLGCRITVVDDASEDKTAEIAKANGAVVIRHPYRMGNGAGIKTGLRKAQADTVVLMDGDGQHPPQDIPNLLKDMDSFDMVIGARKFSNLTLRNFANKFYNGFASYVTLFKIQDLTCGFRAVRRKEAIKFLYLLPNTFSYPSTLTLAFLKTGRTIKYTRITSIPRQHGKSKINVLQDGVKFFLIITRIATFFSPLRVFVPVSLFFFISGFLYYFYTFFAFHRFTNMSVLFLTTAVIIFMLGLISEQIASLKMEKADSA